MITIFYCVLSSPFTTGVVGLQQAPSYLGHCHLPLVSSASNVNMTRFKISSPASPAGQAASGSVMLQHAPLPKRPPSSLAGKPVREWNPTARHHSAQLTTINSGILATSASARAGGPAASPAASAHPSLVFSSAH